MHASWCLGTSASWTHAIAVIDADLGTPWNTTELGEAMEHAVVRAVCSSSEACTGLDWTVALFNAAPDAAKENSVPGKLRPCRRGCS